jgi:hypothetical protein
MASSSKIFHIGLGFKISSPNTLIQQKLCTHKSNTSPNKPFCKDPNGVCVLQRVLYPFEHFKQTPLLVYVAILWKDSLDVIIFILLLLKFLHNDLPWFYD